VSAHPKFVDRLLAKMKAMGGLRAFAREIEENPSKATLSRITRYYDVELSTARHLGELVGVCPCCGRKYPPAEGG